MNLKSKHTHSLATLTIGGLLVLSSQFVRAEPDSKQLKSITAPITKCPSEFNQIKIPLDGKLCQIFAADYPASMVMFIPKSPDVVIARYLAEHLELNETKRANSRVLLQSKDKNTTVIVSADGQGSQVDILVKTPTT